MATYAPRHVDIWGFTAPYSTSATFTRAVSTTSLGMGAGYASDATSINNYLSWMVAVDSGTWTLTCVTYGFTDRGIVTWTLDGVSLGTTDLYRASPTLNLVVQIVGFTVATAGVYELKQQVLSKHASSTGYAQTAQLVTLTRTGA